MIRSCWGPENRSVSSVRVLSQVQRQMSFGLNQYLALGMAGIPSKQKISISPGGRIIHTFSDSGFQEALSGPLVLSRHTCNLEGGIIIMVHEKTEVKRLDQGHTAKHVKSQAQTQGNSPHIVSFCSTPTGSGGW